MKNLKLLALTMLMMLAGISFIDAKSKASNGSCGKNRHLKTRQAKCRTKCKKGKCKTKCVPPKTICVWDSGHKPKKSKSATPNGPAILNNMLYSQTPVTFFNQEDGTQISAGLPNNIISGNDGTNDTYYVNVPSGAAYVVAGPNTEDTLGDDDDTGSLSGLTPGHTYQITADNDGFITVEECLNGTCN